MLNAALTVENEELKRAVATSVQLRGEIEVERNAAETANALKSAFLANMSHEMRTPLGIILGFGEFLLDPNQSPGDRIDCVNTIMRNARQLYNLVNEVLDLAKIEANKLEIETIKFDLPSFIGGIQQSMTVQAKQKGVELSVVSDVAHRVVATDPTLLRQILFNVVGNAIKFTAVGSVSVRVRMIPGTTVLEIDVKDTGIGIEPDHTAHIWTPFTQADNTTTRRFGGTGLGLAIAQKTAGALGGTLALTESTVGVGSTFKLLIPVSVHDQLETTTVTTTSETPIAGCRVLLVEDSEDNRLLISRMLTIAGAVVEQAVNGEEGVKMALSSHYDVVLMDVQMPVMDGNEATACLRKNLYRGPILALTASAMKGEKERSLEIGFTDYLTKPVDRRQLISIVAKMKQLNA